MQSWLSFCSPYKKKLKPKQKCGTGPTDCNYTLKFGFFRSDPMAFKGTSPKNLMTNSLIISLVKLPKIMFIKENSLLIWFIILNRHSQAWIVTGRLPPSWNFRKHYFTITECFSLSSQIADIAHTALEIESCTAFLKAVKEGLFRKRFASATQFSEVRVSCSFTLLYAVDLSHHLIHFYRQTLTNSIHLET